MKIKKILPYIVVLGVGLLLGWLFFGDKTKENISNNSEKEKVNTHNHDKIEEWTCSMHPQIHQSEYGSCPICGMDLILIDLEDSKLEEKIADYQIKMSDNAIELANIQTTKIGINEQEIYKENTLELSGQVEENESSLYTQTVHIGGRLENFKVTYEGEFVKKGQFIGSIYSPEIVTAQQELLIASESKKTQPEIYKSVRQKLKLWKLSNAEINEIERSQKIKTNFPLYADAAGVVKQKIATIGSHVESGAPLYTLTNLSSVWVVLEAYEKDIQSLKRGQKVSLKTMAYPNESFKGVISFIEPILNTQTRTIPIRVEISNKMMKLKPGMLISAVVKLPLNESVSKKIIVPKTAVIWTGKRSVVYVKPDSEKSIFEMREVMLGNSIGKNFEIAGGLYEGEEVVTNGVFTIDSEAQLLGKVSVMNSEESKKAKNNISFQVGNEFKEQLNNFFNSYMEIKDLLVKDESEKVIKKAKISLEILKSIDVKNLKDKEKIEWLSLDKEFGIILKNISNSKDITMQRAQFKRFSDSFILAIKAFGIEQKVYELHCPMANDNKGANWLSVENQVLNPYFGSKMLKCGEVRKTY